MMRTSNDKVPEQYSVAFLYKRQSASNRRTNDHERCAFCGPVKNMKRQLYTVRLWIGARVVAWGVYDYR
jgi:hypothetical protein